MKHLVRKYLVHWHCSYCSHYLSVVKVYDNYTAGAECSACKKKHSFPTSKLMKRQP